MDVSVLICTRNRAASLARTLDSILLAEIPPDLSWEIIVTDNGSTDNTAQIVARYADKLPVRCEQEARAGLSNARNRAQSVAIGRYLVWTDDDVVVDRDWLCAYWRAFHRWPEADLFAGHIKPRLEEPTPIWFRENIDLMGYVLALRDFGDTPLPLSDAEGRLPFGANFAISRMAQAAFPYDPALGVAPGAARTGEETSMARALLAAGHSGYSVPDSLVWHCIPQHRQTWRYVAAYYLAHGRTQAFQEDDGRPAPLLRAPRWLWRRVAERWLRYHLARLNASKRDRIMRLVEYAFDRGMLSYWLNRRARSHSPYT